MLLDTIELLKRIGLSDLESRCYMTLAEQGNMTGYEVAKRVSVSRTNVYAALRSLMDKGACRVQGSDPVQYDAIPIEQLVRHLRSDFERTSEQLVQELAFPAKRTSSFYNWQGRDALEQAIGRITANADHTLIVDIWAEDLQLFEPYLVSAQASGVQVVLITLGDVQSGVRTRLLHKRKEGAPASEPRKFTVLADATAALVGSFGGDRKPSALETDHPAICAMLRNEFYHDLIMIRVESDFGELLTEKYGASYEKILEQYRL